jgi:hypothetical protein
MATGVLAMRYEAPPAEKGMATRTAACWESAATTKSSNPAEQAAEVLLSA